MKKLNALLKSKNLELAYYAQSSLKTLVLIGDGNERVNMSTYPIKIRPVYPKGASPLQKAKALSDAKDDIRTTFVANYIATNPNCLEFRYLHIIEEPWTKVPPAQMTYDIGFNLDLGERKTDFAFVFSRRPLRPEKL